eukprot:TRINITY_DN15322_c0_g1_i1.p1 TRINITY_DN15322_c0_g1~~TRINITY_DN15322_c0_g1_i1.p1  ORF type:complete len:435 (-),score=120.43 TRINITY_DN15322_c0_g1_i1:259-1563(-)
MLRFAARCATRTGVQGIQRISQSVIGNHSTRSNAAMAILQGKKSIAPRSYRFANFAPKQKEHQFPIRREPYFQHKILRASAGVVGGFTGLKILRAYADQHPEDVEILSTHESIDEKDAEPIEEADPFSYDTPMTFYEVCKMAFGAAFLLPFRLFVLIPSLIAIVAFGRLAVLGMKQQDLEKPLPAWRRSLLIPVQLLGALVFFVFGFYKITIKGHPSPNAPIMVSNHITILDPMIYFIKFLPLMVAKKEIASMFLAGKPLSGCTILVDRTDRMSKTNAVTAIKERAKLAESGDGQKILIFPEGTTTNGKALIFFKPGAFVPGLPVQPVCIRYPYKHFNPAWITGGPSIYLIVLRASTQLINHAEIEFLDPYYPSAEERSDPNLYARNVRKVMANHMRVPTTEHTYQDVLRLMGRVPRAATHVRDVPIPTVVPNV